MYFDYNVKKQWMTKCFWLVNRRQEKTIYRLVKTNRLLQERAKLWKKPMRTQKEHAQKLHTCKCQDSTHVSFSASNYLEWVFPTTFSKPNNTNNEKPLT